MGILQNFKLFQYLLLQSKYYRSGRVNLVSHANMDVGSVESALASWESNE